MTPLQATAGTTATIFWLFLLGVYLAFVLIALWVFPDARSRGMNGWFWLIAVAGVPLFGLVAYVILRRERTA